jgi:acyl carrier protein
MERFLAEIAEIAGLDAAGVTPESRLVGDLDLDSLAFAELAVLMMERYGSENFLQAIAEDVEVDTLTVRSVFENYAATATATGVSRL